MAELMRMPEIAAGANEAILSEWLVAEGANVDVGDPVAVIETDKAQVEVESETAGVMLKLLVEESRLVEVGAPMAVLGSPAEVEVDLAELLGSLGLPSTDTASAPAPPRRDVPPAAQASAPLPVDLTQSDEGRPVVPTPAAHDGSARRFITPIARRMLREAGLDGSDIVGSGPGGRVVRRDVEQRIIAGLETASTSVLGGGPASAPAAPRAADSTSPERTGRAAATTQEHSRLRRAVARRLLESKQSIPHFYVKRDARIDSLLELRSELNARTQVRISVNDFVLRAVAQAHMDVPDANVAWTDDAMLRFHTADIAVAIASDRGLITPVLRSVERMSLGTIATEVRDFVDRANNGSLKQLELEGGTISVTNLGMYGVDEFSAIINPPHVAILAVGTATPQPVVVDGLVQVGTVMSLVLSADHRAIDGALAAQWLQALVDALENPYRLLV